MFKYCPTCQKNIHNSYFRDTPNGRQAFCPRCESPIVDLVPKAQARSKEPVDYDKLYRNYGFTLDQVRYLKHMNQKQHDKVAAALKQTVDIDTKLTILEEALKEKESK